MKKIVARDIMTEKVITIPMDMPIREAAEFLIEKMISGAPVVDEAGKLCGVISLTDLARATAEGMHVKKEEEKSAPFYERAWDAPLNEEDWRNLHMESFEGLTVGDVMTPVIFSVTDDAPLEEIVDIMVKGKIHRVFVTKEDKVCGIITTMDVLKIVPELLKERVE